MFLSLSSCLRYITITVTGFYPVKNVFNNSQNILRLEKHTKGKV